MACPLCGEHCRCAEPRAFVSAPEFIDPDAPDDSEAQFAASLETFAAPQPRYNRIIMPQPTPPSEPQFASAVQDQFALAPQPELPASADADRWREEVANRLHNYRAKRRRRAGQNSMELDFEPPAPPPPAATYEAAALAPAAAEAPPVAEPEPQTVVRWDGTVDAPEPRLPDVWNVIPFPAPEPEFPRADELAEPVLTTPRILDVPEMVEQALPTPLSEISLEPEEAQALDDIEIPLQVAPLPQRLFGGVVDLVIVLAATTM